MVEPSAPGYHDDKAAVLARLKRIEGQIRGLQRMVDRRRGLRALRDLLNARPGVREDDAGPPTVAFLAAAYRAADVGLVYPVARGSAPVLALAGAVLVMGRPTSVGMSRRKRVA